MRHTSANMENIRMKNKISGFFSGRNGPDALARTQLLIGVICMPASYLLTGKLNNYPSFILEILSMTLIIMSMVRTMSRNLYLRQTQNARFTGFFSGIKSGLQIRREHFKQRRDWKFFRCPQCGAWLRVPRGKGRLHITCKCGYILYRKT